ncbi:MAG: selenide, water dikinase SelD, partial [Gammaproteobacteria bacterium]|nr:selenide, water dikinase SelD [Gammaproteobacteria bacterium]
SPETAQQVVEGGRQACKDAGIPLAGGHSIDAPEPIFGLAVTGSVERRHLKRNDTAAAGNGLYLTKPLGIGILTTAQKQKKLRPEHRHIAKDAMCELNDIGLKLARIDGVTAMTDVTGYGLLGHLSEMCQGSGLRARIHFDQISLLEGTEEYRQQGCIPGGTERNFESYGAAIGTMTEAEKQILCDPQTSGGLLVAVAPQAEAEVLTIARRSGRSLARIGQLMESSGDMLVEIVSATFTT